MRGRRSSTSPPATPAPARPPTSTGQPRSERGTQSGAEHFDYTLQDPHCVFQIVKRHFSRYTPEVVEEVCGVPRDLFLEVAEAVCENSGPERTTAFCHAVGWTQQTSR